MPDYQKAKIYKIYSVSNEELVYYGSTTERLSTRLAKHIYDYKNKKQATIKLIFDAGDYKIELVENYSCVNKQELEKKEGEYIKNNVCVNKRIERRTLKENYQDNKKHIEEKKKEWRDNNKEYNKQYNKQYRDNNKEYLSKKSKEKITCKCGCLIVKANIARHQKTPKHIKLMEDMIN